MGSVKFVPAAKVINSTVNLSLDAPGQVLSGANTAQNLSALPTTLCSVFPATKLKRESQGMVSHQVVVAVATLPVVVVVVLISLLPMVVGETLVILMVMEGNLAIHTLSPTSLL
jgi:hypothetical protein